MNIESILEGLAGQMLEQAQFHGGKIHVCFFNDELEARRSKHTLENHPVFYIAESEEIKKGLTKADWNILRTKIFNFLQEKQ